MMKKISIDRAYIFAPALHVVLRSEISGNPSITDLKKAITYATGRYEILNSYILDDTCGDFYYVPKQVPTVPHIEERNYILSAEEFINEQERIEFDLEKGEVSRFIIEKDGETLMLSMVQHHLVGDGKSNLMLLENIMENLEKIEAGKEEELQNQEMVPINLRNQKDMEKVVELSPLLKMTAEEMNRKWEASGEYQFSHSDLHEFFKSYWEEHKTKIAEASFDIEEVKAFAKACKENGVTVNTGIMTSIARSLQKKSKLCSAVDCRNESQDALGNYASSVIIEVGYNEKMSFWDNARLIHQLMSCQLANRNELLAGLLFMNEFDNSLIDASYFAIAGAIENSVANEFNNILGVGGEGIPLLISNLGYNPIKTTYGKNTIEQTAFFSPLCPGYKSNMGVITVNKKLTVNLQYEEGGIDYSKVVRDLAVAIHEISGAAMEEKEMAYVYA